MQLGNLDITFDAMAIDTVTQILQGLSRAEGLNYLPFIVLSNKPKTDELRRTLRYINLTDVTTTYSHLPRA